MLQDMDENSVILQTLKDNKSDVTSCDFGRNFLLAIGSSDKSVRILEWKTEFGFVDINYSPLLSHRYGVTWVRFSPQGTMLASASVDGTTILWNVKNGSKIYILVQPSKSSVRRCEFTCDSTKLITAGDDGVLCFWNIGHRTYISKHWLHDDEDSCVQGLAISPDSEYMISGDSNGVLKLWSLAEIKQDHLCPLNTLKNVHKGITCCEFSPNFDVTGSNVFDYKYSFATCGFDSLVKLWNLNIKKKLKCLTSPETTNCDVYIIRILAGHSNDVLSIRYNFNGSMIASTGLDKTVKLWQVENGECVQNFIGHNRYGTCCAFSKKSALLASGSSDKTIIIWNLKSKIGLASELMKECSTLSHFSGGGSSSILSEEIVIHQYENESNRLELLQTLDHSSSVNTVHFHGNNLLATAGGNKSVTIWKRSGDSPFVIDNVLEGHKYSINQLELSPCGTKLISCSVNGIIIFWDLQTSFTYEMRTPNCTSSVRSNRFSPNSELIAAAGDDQKVFLWDAKNLEFIKTLQEHKDAITSVAFSCDSKLIASACCAGDLKIYHLATDNYFATKDGAHDLGATCCDFSPQNIQSGGDDTLLEYEFASCGNDSLIKIWKVSLNNFLLLRELSSHGGNVNYVRFSHQVPRLLVSCATDHTARLWDMDSGQCLHVFYNHGSIVTTCSFSQDSSLLATGSLDKTVIIWALPSENKLDRTIITRNSMKSLQHWSTSDIVNWFNELGFPEIAWKVKSTSLNGQQLLGLKINQILDIIGLVGDNRKAVGLHLYWAKSEAKGNYSQYRLQSNAPHNFLCPITHEIMSDPVICSDGFTYERDAITEWLMCGKFTSPMTNEPLSDLNFMSNTTLKIDIFKYLYGEEVKE